MRRRVVALEPSAAYEAPLLRDAFASRGWEIVDDASRASLHWAKARDVRWDRVLGGGGNDDAATCVANRLVLKTALTRKADLATLVRRHAERVGLDASPVAAATPETHVIDGDDDSDGDDEEANENDDANVGTEKRRRLPRWLLSDADADAARRRRRWVLKASESDRGERIAFFDASVPADVARAEALMASCPRDASWVLQRHVERPMLVDGARKCHLRVMILVSGDARVFVHENVVALCSDRAWDATDMRDVAAHATNHRVQVKARRRAARGAVEDEDPRSRELLGDDDANALTLTEMCERVEIDDDDGGVHEKKKSENVAGSSSSSSRDLETHIRGQLRAIVRDLFLAARDKKTVAPVGFFPTHGTFELLGADFLVDARGKVWLLEVNGDPCLAVYGERLRPKCAEVLRDVVDVVAPLAEDGERAEHERRLAYDHAAEEEEEYGTSTGAVGTHGGFALVLSLPPRFPNDASEGRRRVAKLLSTMSAFVGKGKETFARRSACIARGSPGASGAASALAAADWELTDDLRSQTTSMQWATHEDVSWERVLDGEGTTTTTTTTTTTRARRRLVASHYYARGVLLCASRLSNALISNGVLGVVPVSATLTRGGIEAAGGADAAAAALRRAGGGGGGDCAWEVEEDATTSSTTIKTKTKTTTRHRCASAEVAASRVLHGDARAWRVRQLVGDGGGGDGGDGNASSSSFDARVVALLLGSAPRVCVHRRVEIRRADVPEGSWTSLDDDDGDGSMDERSRREARDAVNAAVVATVRGVVGGGVGGTATATETKLRRRFLPFRNCFEAFVVRVVVARRGGGGDDSPDEPSRRGYRAWVLGFEDAFKSEFGGGGGAADALAADVVSEAVRFFWGEGEERMGGDAPFEVAHAGEFASLDG